MPIAIYMPTLRRFLTPRPSPVIPLICGKCYYTRGRHLAIERDIAAYVWILRNTSLVCSIAKCLPLVQSCPRSFGTVTPTMENCHHTTRRLKKKKSSRLTCFPRQEQPFSWNDRMDLYHSAVHSTLASTSLTLAQGVILQSSNPGSRKIGWSAFPCFRPLFFIWLPEHLVS